MLAEPVVADTRHFYWREARLCIRPPGWSGPCMWIKNLSGSLSPPLLPLSLLPLTIAQQSEGQTNMFTPRAVSFHISIKAAMEVGDLNGGRNVYMCLCHVGRQCLSVCSHGCYAVDPLFFPHRYDWKTPIIRASVFLLCYQIFNDFSCSK